MNSLTYRIAELRPTLQPFAEYAIWPAAFLLATTISQTPAYLAALLLVLTTDIIDTKRNHSQLFRDTLAGATTTLLALLLSNQLGLIIGPIVSTIALARNFQKHSL